MAEYIIMPKLGFDMDKGTIVKWVKKEGDFIKEQEVIFEIETDKTIMEVETQVSGVLRKILVTEGEEVPVTLPIAIIGDKDENINKMIAEAYRKLRKSEKVEVEGSKTNKEISPLIEEKQEKEPKEQKEKFKKITPGARKKAKELGIEIQLVEGSYPGRVVIEKDVISYYQNHYDITKRTDKNREKRSYAGMRKIIGERLSQSKFTAPHVYFTISVDMSKIMELIKRFNQNVEKKISINDFLVFVVAKVLSEQPNMNCSLIDEEIIYHKNINIGIAVSLEEGLIVPVVKNADKKILCILSKEIKEMIKLARDKKLMPDDYKGGTFTLSNLGMYGIEDFTAIINPPEAAILAVGAIEKKPIVVEEESGEKIEICSIMKITLSVDHRLVDGVIAAKFLNRLKGYLELPDDLIL
jgi:pyruvate dehydrogenase E2 component (dihydrolipoamide acetyltransferase)